MEPTYRDGGFTFCLAPRYLFSEPSRGDVVAVRLAGRRIMYLKRIVALAGETVAFDRGRLVVDGMLMPEPYVIYWGEWNLPPRLVKNGHVYVVGDNRSIPMESHVFGQTPIERIVGTPLW